MPAAPRAAPLEIGGRRLEAAWWGPGPDAAPTLVLLHEGLGSVSAWKDFPERLADATGLGVLAYSRFCYGQSDPAPLPWPLTYMHTEAREVLPRVLDAAGVRRCVLLGHSDGGSIAAIHAGSHQDARVRGLVLLALVVGGGGAMALSRRRRRRRWEQQEQEQLEEVIERRGSVFTDQPGRDCFYKPDFVLSAKGLQGVGVSYLCAFPQPQEQQGRQGG